MMKLLRVTIIALLAAMVLGDSSSKALRGELKVEPDTLKNVQLKNVQSPVVTYHETTNAGPQHCHGTCSHQASEELCNGSCGGQGGHTSRDINGKSCNWDPSKPIKCSVSLKHVPSQVVTYHETTNAGPQPCIGTCSHQASKELCRGSCGGQGGPESRDVHGKYCDWNPSKPIKCYAMARVGHF